MVTRFKGKKEEKMKIKEITWRLKKNSLTLRGTSSLQR
ncbi:hypothetical protein V6Z12_D03G076600 [Gossypium hirsutum]